MGTYMGFLKKLLRLKGAYNLRDLIAIADEELERALQPEAELTGES